MIPEGAKQHPDFANYYITNNGKVWSYKRQKFLSLFLLNSGYRYVSLYKNGKGYRKGIHRLVLEVFIGLCPDGKECCHNNGNRLDNKLENLRWGTRSENQKDAIKHGTHVCLTQKGESHNRAKLTEQDVRMIIYIYRTNLFLQREIAEIYKVNQSQVSKIVLKKNWKYIWKN